MYQSPHFHRETVPHLRHSRKQPSLLTRVTFHECSLHGFGSPCSPMSTDRESDPAPRVGNAEFYRQTLGAKTARAPTIPHPPPDHQRTAPTLLDANRRQRFGWRQAPTASAQSRVQSTDEPGTGSDPRPDTLSGPEHLPRVELGHPAWKAGTSPFCHRCTHSV